MPAHGERQRGRCSCRVAGGGWLPIGRGVLTEHMTLANDGNSFDSTIEFEPFDAVGNPATGGGSAAARGARIAF